MLAIDLRASGWRSKTVMRESSESLLRFLEVTCSAYISRALANEVDSASLRLTNTPASISRLIMVAHVFASAWMLNVLVCKGHPLRLTCTCHCDGPRFRIVAIRILGVTKLCQIS